MNLDLDWTGLATNEAEFLFSVDGLTPGTLRPRRFVATEAISEPYELQVELLCENSDLDLGALIGKSAVLTAIHAGGTRNFHGLISKMQVEGRGRGYSRYRATVVPDLWLLTQRVDCRIFQAKSTLEILQDVFEAVGITGTGLELRLNREYQPRDYCVQYRETDFAFVSRLMEEEGICYFFSHSDSGHILILADDTIAHETLKEGSFARYRPPRLAGGAGQFVREVHFSNVIRPVRATLRDYAFKTPSTDLEATEPFEGSMPERSDNLEVYQFPGDYVEAGFGAVLARIRMEELQRERAQLVGKSDLRKFIPGFIMELSDHPRGSLNSEFLLTGVVHEGTQPSVDDPEAGKADTTYHNRFAAIPSETPFRPPRITPRPTVPGLQTAVVTGPAGEEIYVDEFGRIKVQFHWDRLGQRDESSSCWVRVSQAWAGAGWGQINLPRIGQEVIVQFLEGDPDRPLVTGRVYNGENALPYSLPEERTKSTLKSNSSPGGGGSNEFRFEDKAGGEEIFLHGQKDWTIAIDNDKNQKVSHDETHTVGNDRTTSIGNNDTLTVTADRSATVQGSDTVTVTKSRTVAVSGKKTMTIKKDFDTTVEKGNASMTVSKGTYAISTSTKDVTVYAKEHVKIRGDLTALLSSKDTAVVGDNSFTVGAKTYGCIGAEKIEMGGTDISIQASDKLFAGGKVVTMEGADKIVLQVGGSSIELSAAGITLSAPKITSSALGVQEISAALVKVN